MGWVLGTTAYCGFRVRKLGDGQKVGEVRDGRTKKTTAKLGTKKNKKRVSTGTGVKIAV